MSNPNKAKGTKWESDVRAYLRSQDLPARRAAQEGRFDVGDIHGIEPFVGQAKAWKDIVAALRVGVDGAQEQARNAGLDFGVNFVKRARASTERGYAAMTIETFAHVLKRLRAAETYIAYSNPGYYTQHMAAHGRP